MFTHPTFDLSTVPEKDRDRVAALIPDPRIADGYVHRDAMPGVYDFDALDGAMALRHNVKLEGPTGSSKTTFFRAYAAARGLPLAIVECSANMDPRSVLGHRDIDPATELPIWIDGDHTLVIRYGGVLLYDEANLAHQRVTAAFHGVTSVSRRLDLQDNNEVIRCGFGGTGAPQPVLIGCAINPTTYTGTTRMNQAFRNRFQMPIDWPYSREVEEQLIASTTLLDVADGIRSLIEVQSPTATNMLIEFERHVTAFGIEAAIVLFVNHYDADEVGPIERALEAASAAIFDEVIGGTADVDVESTVGVVTD